MAAVMIALKYWREILIVLAVIVLLLLAGYVKHIFADRDRLDRENAMLKKDLESAVKLQQLTNQISEAISQIKIRSSINVSRIEGEIKPVFVDTSHPVVLVPGGLLQAVYSSNSAHRAATVDAPGGSVAPGKPGG